MAVKGGKGKAPMQQGLFEASVQIADVNNLPWIVDATLGAIEVRAPGSIYEPILLTPQQQHIEVRPGKLHEREELFVRDLIKHLYPHGGQPWSAQTPLKWEGREVWFKRNVENRKDSFCLRVDDSDWFYPDFILWIIDRATRTQTFGFVDPKGLQLGIGKGWGDYKVVSTLYMPHVVERQLGVDGLKVDYEGAEWTFRIRGVLVSTSSYANLSEQAKFAVHNEHDKLVAPSLEDFRHGRIVFQERKHEYIGQMLDLLIQDAELDEALKRVAALFDAGGNLSAVDELDHDLLIRHRALGESCSESDFVQDLVRDTLKFPDPAQAAAMRGRRAAEKLGRYASEGRLMGLGAEKAAVLYNHPTPCAELWKRMTAGKS
jgi:hypothetical protein